MSMSFCTLAFTVLYRFGPSPSVRVSGASCTMSLCWFSRV